MGLLFKQRTWIGKIRVKAFFRDSTKMSLFNLGRSSIQDLTITVSFITQTNVLMEAHNAKLLSFSTEVIKCIPGQASE